MTFMFIFYWNMCVFLVGSRWKGQEDSHLSVNYDKTMTHNRKPCVILYLEDEYKQLVLECHKKAKAKEKVGNNRYRFSCIHYNMSFKDKNIISYHIMFKLCPMYKGTKLLKMYPTWDTSDQKKMDKNMAWSSPYHALLFGLLTIFHPMSTLMRSIWASRIRVLIDSQMCGPLPSALRTPPPNKMSRMNKLNHKARPPLRDTWKWVSVDHKVDASQYHIAANEGASNVGWTTKWSSDNKDFKVVKHNTLVLHGGSSMWTGHEAKWLA